MALIPCSECGQSISDQAEACPHCGCPAGAARQEDAGQEAARHAEAIAGLRRLQIVFVLFFLAGVALVVGGFLIQDYDLRPVFLTVGFSLATVAYVALVFAASAVDKRQRARRPDGVCPKCGSRSIAALKSDYDLGLGCCGTVVLGPFGILCGLLGAGEVSVHCLNCKHKWRA